MPSTLIAQRKIEEVLHFTRHSGLTGIVASGKSLSRIQLPEEERLEFIYEYNADRVLDPEWADYVNMSISRINIDFFNKARNWHPDDTWYILSYRPEILTHEGVFFSTTNNIYSGVRRVAGLAGLQALFNDSVHQYQTRYARRYDEMPSHYPTCRQAEVLYPRELSNDYLQRIYVQKEEDTDQTSQIFAGLNCSFEVVVDHTMFE